MDAKKLKNKISYTINDKVFNITTLSNRYFLLGYLESTNKIYLINKDLQLISYTFPYSFVKYQMAILDKDFTEAEKLLIKIPESFNDSVFKFLEKFELYELCYKITKNPNQKFSLAIKLKKLLEAYEIAKNSKNSEKLKMVSDLAIELGEFNFAEKAMKEAKDWNGLLLYYSSIQNRKKLKIFATEAKKEGIFNVAFSSFFQLNNYQECLNILLDSRRYPEAAVFARTYIPSKLNDVIELWNKQIEEEDKNNRITMKIVSPINKDNQEDLMKTENIYQQFYDILDNDSNKISQESINNFQKFDFYKEIQNGNEINLNEILGAHNINLNEKKEINEIKEDNKDNKKIEEIKVVKENNNINNNISNNNNINTQKEEEEEEEEGEEEEDEVKEQGK